MTFTILWPPHTTSLSETHKHISTHTHVCYYSSFQSFSSTHKCEKSTHTHTQTINCIYTWLGLTTHTHTYWAPGGPKKTYRVCRLQLHPSPLSPPLHFITFYPSIILSLSFSLILPHPTHCLPLPLPLSFFHLSLLCSCLVSFPLTFKPTSAFERRALYPSLPRLSSLRFPSQSSSSP